MYGQPPDFGGNIALLARNILAVLQKGLFLAYNWRFRFCVIPGY